MLTKYLNDSNGMVLIISLQLDSQIYSLFMNTILTILIIFQSIPIFTKDTVKMIEYTIPDKAVSNQKDESEYCKK